MTSSSSSQGDAGSETVRQFSRPLSYKAGDHSLGYQETLMYGHYSSLRQYARKEAIKYTGDNLPSDTKGGHSMTSSLCSETIQQRCLSSSRALCGRFAQDWMFLTILGFVVALFSFTIDLTVEQCLIGSGIPEVKTILKGVVLKECLTFRTLVAKVVGLSSALASTMPFGKMGPFVHIASASAAVLSKLFMSLRNEMENESRNIDILTAAAAVGVSSTFAAPIGGVLFSIEATATYFAVRNYWRGFYSAICGAIMFQLLSIWFRDDGTLTALFKTNLRDDVPYEAIEILTFSAVGLICGALGALFVFTHTNIVLFIRRQKRLSTFLQNHRFIYPSFVTFLVASILFPAGSGDYMAGHLTLREAVNQMFDNKTWSTYEPVDFVEASMLNVWKGPANNVLLTVFLFLVNRFWMCAICTTMPVPCGLFIPAFTLGAATGRLIGELLAVAFPDGFGGKLIMPGYYATVGAAAFSGAITHTVSPAVIVFELTGQMGHILPCVLATMVANVMANLLQPSVYDAIIKIKKLPFLPPSIDPDVCYAHQVYAEDFMISSIVYLTLDSTYSEAYRLVSLHQFRSYPIVDCKENMELLGTVHRKELKRILEDQFTPHRRMHNLAEHCDTATDEHVPPNGISVETIEPKEILVRRTSGVIRRYSVATIIDDAAKRASIFRRISVDQRSAKSVLPVPSDPKVKFLIVEDKPRKSSCTSTNNNNINMEENEEMEWELHQIRQRINFEECFIDPAPFQIPGKTSLYKVHSLFSLLSLHHAYVTSGGRLVGIVSLSEVRKAIEGEIQILPTIRKRIKELRSEAGVHDEESLLAPQKSN